MIVFDAFIDPPLPVFFTKQPIYRFTKIYLKLEQNIDKIRHNSKTASLKT